MGSDSNFLSGFAYRSARVHSAVILLTRWAGPNLQVIARGVSLERSHRIRRRTGSLVDSQAAIPQKAALIRAPALSPPTSSLHDYFSTSLTSARRSMFTIVSTIAPS